MKPGAKYYEWEGRGVPLRLEIGPRDVAAGTVMLARRTGGKKETAAAGGLPARLDGGDGAMQARPAGDRPGPPRGASIRGATKAAVPRPAGGRRRLRLRRLLRARRVRGGDQGADQGDDPGAAR